MNVFQKMKSSMKKLMTKVKSFNHKKNKDEAPKKDLADSKGLNNFFKGRGASFGKVLGKKASFLKRKLSGKKKNDFKFSEFINSIFDPKSRAYANKVFLYSFFVVFAFIIGKTIGLFLTPSVISNKRTSPPRAAVKKVNIKAEMAAIKTADIFNSTTSGPKKKTNDEDVICLISNTPSTIPVKLVSTVVLQDSVKSVASVQIRGSELLNVREGERISSYAEVGKIGRLNLVIKNLETGICETIESDESKKEKPRLNVVSQRKGKPLLRRAKNDQIESDGKTFKIKKSLRDEMLKDISKILTQAKAVQMRNPDGSYCFKMTEVEAGSVYSLLDIRDGDTVCKVNGSKITNLNDLVNMFGKIKQIEKFNIGLTRDGQKSDKSYLFID